MSDRRVVDYYTACAEVTIIDDDVQQLLNQGWCLFGPPTALCISAESAEDCGKIYVVQAMVMYAPPCDLHPGSPLNEEGYCRVCAEGEAFARRQIEKANEGKP